MTILQSLARAYDRLAATGEAAPFGYSSQQIAFLIVLDEAGQVVGAPIDLRIATGRKLTNRSLNVPQPPKRTRAILPNYLWDKTAYVLGITAGEGKRTAQEHAAFVEYHREHLTGTKDAGLLAFLRFLNGWTPEQFAERGWPEEMKDQNLVFALGDDYRRNIFLHDRPAARALWARMSAADGVPDGRCLVSGERAPIARLHPSIKGVWGAQSAGASIVSFNADAFTSYGHEQGDNAPVSEAATAAYTTVLNKFLARGSRNRIQIGDASTVFWADCDEANRAAEAEALFAAILGGEAREHDEALEEQKRILPALEALREGRLIAARPDLAKGIRFYVLGLAPNAARLSVRYWFDDDFGRLAERLARHTEAMRIEPEPRVFPTPLWMCLTELAPQGKTENVPPNLAGEWLRAILTGTPYPLTLQATLLMRIRADKTLDALRAAILKAGLITRGRKVPVSFDPDNRDRGYLLGRLFAIYEHVQSAALGGVNASIRDKFYGAASATPRKVFPVLDRGSANHLGKMRRDKPGYAVVLEKQIGAVMAVFSPADDPFPTALAADEQALFAVGYYHQKNEFFRKKDEGSSEAATDTGSH